MLNKQRRYRCWCPKLLTSWPFSFIFLMLAFIRLSSDHSIRPPAAHCIFHSAPGISDSVVLLTNLCVSKHNRRSQIRIIKVNDPHQEPWGMPPPSVTYFRYLLTAGIHKRMMLSNAQWNLECHTSWVTDRQCCGQRGQMPSHSRHAIRALTGRRQALCANGVVHPPTHEL